MKKFNLRHFIFLLLLFVMIAFFTALISYFPNKKVDFSGTVTKISTEGEITVLEISNENGATYVVELDSKTKISPCHKDDPKVSLDDISVGTKISGNFRKGTDKTAKSVKVFLE